MALSLPSINIGISTKKAHFDKTHDVSTTSDFGFVQPTLFDDIIPNTTVKLRTHSKIMLAPMPQQTFSRIQMHTTNVFVPMKDVYLAFDHQQTQTTVQSAVRSYIPTEADSITIKGLFYSLFFAPALHLAGTWNQIHKEPLAFTKAWTKDSEGNIAEVTVHSDLMKTALRTLVSSFNTGVAHTYEGYSTFNTANDNIFKYCSTYNYYGKPNYISPSWENADFKIMCSQMVEGKEVFLCFYLSHRGQRVMKVLNGLGYKFGLMGKEVSILPLLAYYKAWFDKYNPPRHVQWKATKAFYLIHSYYDVAYNITHGMTSTDNLYARRYTEFIGFLQQLSDCCYTLPTDPFTACLTNPVEGNNIIQEVVSPVSDTDSSSAYLLTQSLPQASPYDSELPDSIALRMALKLLPMVNKYSVIGARIEQWMKAKYGVSLPRNYQFGENKISCFVDEILASTNYDNGSAGNYLGERGGVSSNKGSSSVTHFTSDTFGFVLQLMCIVPFGGYSQGINPSVCRIKRDDFYDNSLDSLGMEACPTSEFMCDARLIDSSSYGETDETFGFRPRLFNYKYKTNLRNGCFANGQQDAFLGYQLDRIFTPFDYDRVKKDFVGQSPSMWQTTEELRYIGVSEDYGNYDRMFFDVKGTTDNFVIQMIQEYSINSPMLPISESYDTFDKDGLSDDNATMSISHA